MTRLPTFLSALRWPAPADAHADPAALLSTWTHAQGEALVNPSRGNVSRAALMERAAMRAGMSPAERHGALCEGRR